jgi:aldehyde dehydrogenase (NAD+)
LIEKVGFPPGVINVLSGHGHISGQVLSSHMDVRIISFTGSMTTGKLIQEAAAKSNLKNVLLELGGKSPAIVFDDCHLENTVRDTQYSVQWNSGQVCMANSRIYVQDTITDKFIEKFKEVFGAAKLGDPTKSGVTQGPQVDGIQHEKILNYIEEGKKTGKMILGGKPDESLGKGYFVPPTAFINTPEDAKIMREEVFGPVVNINVFHTEKEALEKANNTEFGLYAAVFTKNIDRALRVAKALEAGSIGVNCTSPTVAMDMPFGGWKGSGIGREGIQFSLNNFLEVKTVFIKLGAAE